MPVAPAILYSAIQPHAKFPVAFWKREPILFPPANVCVTFNAGVDVTL